jgi:hypothetical protein
VTKRDRIVLGVVVTAAVLGAYWLLLLGPRGAEAQRLAEKATAAQTRVDEARAKLVTAEAAKRDYGKQLVTVARLGKAVPATDDVPSLVYQLERTAKNADIDFRAVKIEPATAAPAAAAPAPSNGTTPAGGSTPSSTPPPAGAAPAAPVSVLTPMPFKLTFQGEFFDLRRFLDVVHSFAKAKNGTLDVRGRLLTVDGVSLVPGENGFRQVRAQILATAYTAPADLVGSAPAAGAAATPAPGSATPAPGSSTTAQSGTTSTPPPAIVGGLLP